jgi:arginase family enzyme
VRIERRRTDSDHHKEQIQRKYKEHHTGDEDRGDEKVGCVVSFVATIGGGHQMALGIVRMMKSDVVPVEDAAYSVMAEAVMEQGLAA